MPGLSEWRPGNVFLERTNRGNRYWVCVRFFTRKGGGVRAVLREADPAPGGKFDITKKSKILGAEFAPSSWGLNLIGKVQLPPLK